MKTVARLSAEDRSDLFRNTANRMQMSDAIVEKDFWVCFTLDYLFHRSLWKDSITFKGGTSLSKAYHSWLAISMDFHVNPSRSLNVAFPPEFRCSCTA